MPDTTIPARATWRQWLGLAVLSLPVLMLATDITVLFLAMPSISDDLQPTSSQLLWVLHIGEFFAAGLVITMGRVGDRIGRRRLLMLGVATYGFASAVAAFSPDPEMLIGMRGLLGIAAATIMPSTFSLLRSMFQDPKQFTLAVAVNMSAFSAGSAIGPTLGGVLIEYFWWGAVFLANVPAALILVGAARPLLPEYRDPAAGRPDLVSVGLSMTGVIGLIWAMQELALHGFAWTYVAAMTAGSVLTLVFGLRQLRITNPLLDLRLFTSRAFTVSVIVALLVIMTTGADMLFAQHLQSVLGLSPLQAGLWLVIPALVGVVGTMVAPGLLRWIRPAYVMGLGLVLAAAGMAVVALTASDAGVGILITGMALAGAGIGPTLTLTSGLIVASAPLQRAGSASAVEQTTSGLGAAVGMAAFGSIGMAIYRGGLEGSIPGMVPAETAGAVNESVGAGASIASQLPESVRSPLLETIHASFATGVQVAYGIGAVVLAITTVLVVWLLRGVRQVGPEPESEDPPGGRAQEIVGTGASAAISPSDRNLSQTPEGTG